MTADLIRNRVYISSSWKNRDMVRALSSQLKAEGFDVFDFTEPGNRRCVSEIPPELFPEKFDPEKHEYAAFLQNALWMKAVEGNREALDWCDFVVLILPCGIDATADWAYAVGCGKESVVFGCPRAGETSPVHLWANYMTSSFDALLDWLKERAVLTFGEQDY